METLSTRNKSIKLSSDLRAYCGRTVQKFSLDPGASVESRLNGTAPRGNVTHLRAEISIDVVMGGQRILDRGDYELGKVSNSSGFRSTGSSNTLLSSFEDQDHP